MTVKVSMLLHGTKTSFFLKEFELKFILIFMKIKQTSIRIDTIIVKYINTNNTYNIFIYYIFLIQVSQDLS